MLRLPRLSDAATRPVRILHDEWMLVGFIEMHSSESVTAIALHARCHVNLGVSLHVSWAALEQVRAFVDDAYKRTLALVEQHRDLIAGMAGELLRKEVGRQDSGQGRWKLEQCLPSVCADVCEGGGM
jgi:ATP-dependent Zn protease